MDFKKIVKGFLSGFSNENEVIKDSNAEVIYSPMKGRILPLSEVPDAIFAEKMIGDGVAIEPEDNLIVSPVDGEIVTIFDTKHALALRTKSGVELLLHIGIDTVELGGEGFTAFVKEGQRVKTGDKLMEVDFKFIKSKGKSVITPLVVANISEFAGIDEITEGRTEHNSALFRIVSK
jgi:glucose-specific phosphotransferase system IIA component